MQKFVFIRNDQPDKLDVKLNIDSLLAVQFGRIPTEDLKAVSEKFKKEAVECFLLRLETEDATYNVLLLTLERLRGALRDIFTVLGEDISWIDTYQPKEV